MKSALFVAVLLATLSPLVPHTAHATSATIDLAPGVSLQLGERDRRGYYWDGGNWREPRWWNDRYQYNEHRWWRHEEWKRHKAWERDREHERRRHERERWREQDRHHERERRAHWRHGGPPHPHDLHH